MDYVYWQAVSVNIAQGLKVLKVQICNFQIPEKVLSRE